MMLLTRCTRILPVFLAMLLLGSAPALSQSEEKEKGSKPAEKGKGREQDKGKEKDSGKDAETTVRIEIVAGEKDDPVDSASVYIRFWEERTLAKDRMVALNTKTNRNGVAVVPNVPRGKVAVQVIAQGWKTFGQWYDLDKAEQTIKIKLQKPPRWY